MNLEIGKTIKKYRAEKSFAELPDRCSISLGSMIYQILQITVN
jgi:hypothetical protein